MPPLLTSLRHVQLVRAGNVVFEDTVWADNYYHSISENLLMFYMKQCVNLHDCHGSDTQ